MLANLNKNFVNLTPRESFPDNVEAGNNVVSLEELFSFPYFWKPGKICQFFKEAHKLLRDGEAPECQRKHEFSQFKHLISSEACEDCVLSSDDNNWRKVIGETHFYILTTRFVNKNACKKSKLSVNEMCIIDLLKTIRDKYEHSGDIPQDKKMQLGWFTEEGVLSDHLFVEYWCSKFPKLVTFLWIKFLQFRDNLKSFYPLEFTKDEKMLPNDLEGFIKKFPAALKDNTNKGGLISRLNQHSCKNSLLEIRTIEMTTFLEGTLEVTVVIRENYLKVNWNNVNKIDSFLEYGCYGNTSNEIIFIFVNDVSAITGMFSYLKNDSKLIVFTTKIFETELLAKTKPILKSDQRKYVETPVTWTEIESNVRKQIESNGQVIMNNKQIKLADILPENENSREKILSCLNGVTLNLLLKKQPLNIFLKNKIPPVTQNYVQRKIYKAGLVGSSIFHEDMKNDLIVVENISLDRFKTVVNTDKLVVFAYSKQMDIDEYRRANVITIDPVLHNSVLSEHIGVYLDDKHSLHVLRYAQDTKFEWIETLGHIDKFESVISNNPDIILNSLDENDFLLERVNTETGVQNEKVIFLADKPGMGKSQVLSSIGIKLANQSKHGKVFFVCMDQFLDTYNKLIPGRVMEFSEETFTAVLQRVFCGNNFEGELLDSFLNQRDKAAVENTVILFDGQDEVAYYLQDLAMMFLQWIECSQISVQAFVTVRGYMLNNIKEYFKTLGYRLEPFSEKDQIDLLTEHWYAYFERAKESDNQSLDREKLHEFAKNIINLNISGNAVNFAGIPLQCKMLAEIYENDILSSAYLTKSAFKIRDITELYDYLFKRKVEVYLKEKLGLTNINMNTSLVDREMENFERLHTYFAITMLISDTMAEKFAPGLLITNSQKNQLQKIAGSQGIIQSFEPLTFVHRTFAEYMLVNFVFKVLKGHYLVFKESDTIFQEFLWEEFFSVEHKVNEPDNGKEYVEIKYPTFWYFMNAKWKYTLEDFDCNSVRDLILNKLKSTQTIPYTSKLHKFDVHQLFSCLTETTYFYLFDLFAQLLGLQPREMREDSRPVTHFPSHNIQEIF